MNWDDRYAAAPGYLFGTEPAAFLRDHAGMIRPGARALCVADGEGRNSVWLAAQGVEVTAFDASAVALDRARALARGRGVKVAFRQGGVEDFAWGAARYDLVVAVFVQFAGPALRSRLFAGMRQALAPGGRLMLHGYTPEQIALGTGGPRAVENLYTEEMLRASFPDLRILRLASYRRDITEGTGHNGPSALIDLIADAPAG